MSGESSSPAAWWSGLEPAAADLVRGRGDAEDPRLGDVARRWEGGSPHLRPGQPVLIGFPCDEGVRRNGGRPGAARAPDAIRSFLYRLTAWDGHAAVDLAELGFLDLGNVRVGSDLEQAQRRLGDAVAGALQAGAVPVVLGGGHETTFGHFLGYARAELDLAIVNVDAHLDVRPYPAGGHSGSPFRQAMEHPQRPLRPGRYAVLGARGQSVARGHAEFVARQQGRVHWLPDTPPAEWLSTAFAAELDRVRADAGALLLSVDADAFRQADVPGTSAPSPVGLAGDDWPRLAYRAGSEPEVRSIDLVEVNPAFDTDGQTARWAALGVRQFLVGLARRRLRSEQRPPSETRTSP
jgi:formiminoglutamase